MSKRARWAVPGTAVVATAAVIAAFQIPSAEASPNLPAKTPAQLLASLDSDHTALPPMTGTVVESANLGLPQLPQTSGSATSLTSLLTGSHTVKVYYQDEKHFRLAIPQPEAETDIIANGTKVWLWESATKSVTQVNVPAGDGQATPNPAQTPLTPQQAADQILAQVGPTTLVSTQANVMVAGEPSYNLVLAPKDSRSLVGKVVIAVDGKYGMPLRVQVYAKGAAAPAFQVGYTALQWVSPAASNFTFTPPKGASVNVMNPGQEQAKPAQPDTSGVGSYGQDWLTVLSFPQADLTEGVSSTGKQQDIYSASSQGVGVSSQGVLNALLGSGKQVSGSWGSGSLITTNLVSVLITGGKVYVGAVQPSVLYAAVGHTTSAG